MAVQSWQTVNEAALSELGSSARDPLDTILGLLNTKLKVPASLGFTGNVLNVGSSRIDVGPDGKKVGYPPLAGVSIDDLTGTFDFDTGTGTGDVQTATLPTMTADYYVLVGVEIRSDQKIYVIFGSESATEAGAGLPPFLSGSIPVGIVTMQSGATGGQGDWVTPADLSIVTQFGAGAGGGGGGGSVSDTITQASHGFVVGDALRLVGTTWVKAQADSPVNFAHGIVSRVIDTGKFEISFQGKVSGLSGLTAGFFYRLSTGIAGGYSLAAGGNSTLSQTLFLALSSTEAFLFIRHPKGAQ